MVKMELSKSNANIAIKLKKKTKQEEFYFILSYKIRQTRLTPISLFVYNSRSYLLPIWFENYNKYSQIINIQP